MTRSPALTSWACATVTGSAETRAAPATARAVEIKASRLICISVSSSCSARCLLHRVVRSKGVDGGMQRAENSDDCKNHQRQRDLDRAVARQPTKCIALHLV